MSEEARSGANGIAAGAAPAPVLPPGGVVPDGLELHPAMAIMLQQRILLNHRYRVDSVIDQGGFATIFACQDTLNPGNQVVAKVMLDMETDDDGVLPPSAAAIYRPGMKHEHRVYKELKAACSGTPLGIPATYCSSVMKLAHPDRPQKLYILSYLVMQLLGPSLRILAVVQQAYRTNMTLFINHALGMMQALRGLHDQGLVHRDIKPDNFCLPRAGKATTATAAGAPADQVYLLDMGMAMPWQHPGFSWEARDYVFWGTVDYASVRTLRGHHPTPRDDLESMACALLEMATGDVPFDLLHASEECKPLQLSRLREVAELKDRRWAVLLAQDGTPAFIKSWMRQLRSLPPHHVLTASDYQALESILLGALPRAVPAASAWSCATGKPARKGETATGCKRAAPSTSGLPSCASDSATALTVDQCKRARREGAGHCVVAAAEEDDEGASMVCAAFLAVSPGE